ncbi:MAG: hypothetical protein ACRD6X_02660 [Pyrinomonadaceae bacterium]
MNIALIGYGAMGRLIGTLAEEKGHEIVAALGGPSVGEGDTSELNVSPFLACRLLFRSWILQGNKIEVRHR